MKKIKFLLFACLAFSMVLLTGADAQAQSAKKKMTTNLEQASSKAKTVRQAKIQQSANKKTGVTQKGELKAMKKTSTVKAQSLKTVKSDLVKKTTVPTNRTKAGKIEITNLRAKTRELRMKKRNENQQ